MPSDQLAKWIAAVDERNALLKIITAEVDKRVVHAEAITDEAKAADEMVDLLFMSNRIDSMINVWLGTDETED